MQWWNEQNLKKLSIIIQHKGQFQQRSQTYKINFSKSFVSKLRLIDKKRIPECCILIQIKQRLSLATGGPWIKNRAKHFLLTVFLHKSAWLMHVGRCDKQTVGWKFSTAANNQIHFIAWRQLSRSFFIVPDIFQLWHTSRLHVRPIVNIILCAFLLMPQPKWLITIFRWTSINLLCLALLHRQIAVQMFNAFCAVIFIP